MKTEKDLEAVTIDNSNEYIAPKDNKVLSCLAIAFKRRFDIEYAKYNVLKLEYKVSITWHFMDLFLEMFPEYF